MKTKLTLTIENGVFERAKSYAKQTGRSLSELIAQYLDSLTRDSTSEAISPKLKKLMGAVKLPKNFKDKKVLQSYLEKKHL